MHPSRKFIMSDVHISIDMQSEIIKRLPVKSVIRFTSVSKQWKSLIHSSTFVNDYSLHTQHQRLFLFAERDAREPYRFFVDDDAFPQNKSVLFVPESINLLKRSKVVGSSHGLFCLVGSSTTDTKDMVAVIWNPMIRKSVSIDVPNVVFDPNYNVGRDSIIGFGVCPNTCDPKIVKINHKMRPRYPEELEGIGCTNWQVEVYTLSSRVWRSPLGKLPDKWLSFFGKYNEQVVIDGFIYWIVDEKISLKDCNKTLVSFDLTSEEFKQVYLPDELECCSQIFNLRGSLAIFEGERGLVYKVWKRENGASKSFTELFTIKRNYILDYKQPVVRSNGQLIMMDFRNGRLVSYEPFSKHLNDLKVYVNRDSLHRDCDSLYLNSYTESLLLLH